MAKEVALELIEGTGYQTAWMVVEGKTQGAVKKALLKTGTKKRPFQKGIELANGVAAGTEDLVAITKDQKKRCYMIGNAVSRFFYDYETYCKAMSSFPKIYVYMTERVSESHGFALIEKGKLKRFFRYDEDGVESVGEPLPAEEALNLRLPKTWKDTRDQAFTQVTEDTIVALAIQQIGIDVSQYKYEDVVVGELYVDPSDYIEEEELTREEKRELPLVKEFEAYNTNNDRLMFLRRCEKEGKLTHNIIEGIADVCDGPCEGFHLHDRVDMVDFYLMTEVKWEREQYKLMAFWKCEKELDVKDTTIYESVCWDGEHMDGLAVLQIAEIIPKLEALFAGWKKIERYGTDRDGDYYSIRVSEQSVLISVSRTASEEFLTKIKDIMLEYGCPYFNPEGKEVYRKVEE